MKKEANQSKVSRILNLSAIFAVVCVAISSTGILIVSGKLGDANLLRYDMEQSAKQFINASGLLTDQIRAYAVTGAGDHKENYNREIDTDKNRELAIEAMNKMGLSVEEQKIMTEMQGLSNNLVPLEMRAMGLADQGLFAEATQEVYSDEYDVSMERIMQLQKLFADEIGTRTLGLVTGYEMQSQIMWVLNAALLIAVAMLQIYSFFYTRQKIIKPIIAMKAEMEEIAKGHISGEFDMQPTTSEIGLLVNSIISTKSTLQKYIGDISSKLDEMASNNLGIVVDVDYIGDFVPIKLSLEKIISALNSTMHHIDNASRQVLGSAEQVSSGAQALSQGATQQASAVEELAATITEISQQIKNNATNAADAAVKAVAAGGKVKDSNSKMRGLIEAMEDISRSSQEIGKVIKVIEDIAFQTNILALNAAVEAARAGEAGRGFAVVADEVRNLASKSAEAAKSTTMLIKGAVNSVERGTTLVGETANALQSAALDTDLVAGAINNISTASAEQASAIMQVSTGVEQISSVVQTNSATAEQSAAASEELNGQADTLKYLVGQFKLSSKEILKKVPATKKDAEHISHSPSAKKN